MPTFKIPWSCLLHKWTSFMTCSILQQNETFYIKYLAFAHLLLDNHAQLLHFGHHFQPALVLKHFRISMAHSTAFLQLNILNKRFCYFRHFWDFCGLVAHSSPSQKNSIPGPSPANFLLPVSLTAHSTIHFGSGKYLSQRNATNPFQLLQT